MQNAGGGKKAPYKNSCITNLLYANVDVENLSPVYVLQVTECTHASFLNLFKEIHLFFFFLLENQ